MNSEEIVNKLEELKKSFIEFNNAFIATAQAINDLVAEKGIDNNIKSASKNLYYIRVAYLELFKQSLNDLKKNQISEQLNEILNPFESLIKEMLGNAYVEIANFDSK